MKRIHTIITGVLTVLLLTSAGVGALTSGEFTGTDTALQTTTPTDASDGANDETDHRAIDHDVEPAPESAVDAIADVLGRFRLTDAEEDRIMTKVGSLQADGASRARLVDATMHGLHNAGVSNEKMHQVAPELRLRMLLTYFDLTDEQREAVVDAATDTRSDGGDADDVRDTVQEVLESYGVSEDEIRTAWRSLQHERVHLEAHRLHHKQSQLRKQHARFHGGTDGQPAGDLSTLVDNLQERFDLTDEQANEIQREAQAMLENGASREEIKRMIHSKLDEWGKLDSDRDHHRDRNSDQRADDDSDQRSDHDSDERADDDSDQRADDDSDRSRDTGSDDESDSDTDTPTDSDS